MPSVQQEPPVQRADPQPLRTLHFLATFGSVSKHAQATWYTGGLGEARCPSSYQTLKQDRVKDRENMLPQGNLENWLSGGRQTSLSLRTATGC